MWIGITHISKIAVDMIIQSKLWTCISCQDFTNMAHDKKNSYFLYIGFKCNKFSLFSYLIISAVKYT